MFHVAAFYRFSPVADPHGARAAIHAAAEEAGVVGTVLVADEGVNGTIAGTPDGVGAVLGAIRDLPGLAEIRVTESTASSAPFGRLKVRVKPEIVTLGVPGIDARCTGRHVPPDEWQAVLDDPDTVVIDTRNGYETAVGTFPGAVDPGTEGFRDFPAWWDAHGKDFAGRRVAMFCTGGIRCEKASAFLLDRGLPEVLQLDGGILNYLRNVPEGESRWQGECFVFDERTSLGQGLAEGTHVPCFACGGAVSEAARKSPDYREGVCCPACVDSFSEEDRARFAERQRQFEAAARPGAAPRK